MSIMPIVVSGLIGSAVLPLLKLKKFHERSIMIAIGIICGVFMV